jgi:hypothetical protein
MDYEEYMENDRYATNDDTLYEPKIESSCAVVLKV